MTSAPPDAVDPKIGAACLAVGEPNAAGLFARVGIDDGPLLAGRLGRWELGTHLALGRTVSTGSLTSSLRTKISTRESRPGRFSSRVAAGRLVAAALAQPDALGSIPLANKYFIAAWLRA